VRAFFGGGGGGVGSEALTAFGAFAFGAAVFLGAAFFLGAALTVVVFFVVAMSPPAGLEPSITGCDKFWFDTMSDSPIEFFGLVPVLPRNGQALGFTV
jgi:hypothetical protein